MSIHEDEERQPTPGWRVTASAEGHSMGRGASMRGSHRAGFAHYMVSAKRVHAQRFIVFACGREAWASSLYRCTPEFPKCYDCLRKVNKGEVP